MIYGIGIDLASIGRIEKVINKWGDRFLNRVFTSDEIKICGKRSVPFSAFTLRFAAKEAFSKALGLGMRKGIRWRDIEVYNHPTGKPDLKIHGTALGTCKRNGITGIHLSLSDDGNYGIAMVVLERDE
ncbi:holo-ACP synthase [Thermodesulfobacteriota bacterium]